MFGKKPQGTFYAFSPKGEQCIAHRFGANLHSNGISPDGLFAVCQLCNSETSDSGVLAFFDISKRCVLWKIEPITGWADSYGFEAEKGILFLNYINLGSFQYSFRGEFIDSLRWERARIEKADGYTIASMARDKLEALRAHPSDEQARVILDILDVALTRTEQYPSEMAFAHRVRGELYEITGDYKSAISSYRKALELDPRIGVKRRLTALEKNET
jgi:tetratricopeptide (TPR) repeat protein